MNGVDDHGRRDWTFDGESNFERRGQNCAHDGTPAPPSPFPSHAQKPEGGKRGPRVRALFLLARVDLMKQGRCRRRGSLTVEG